MKRFLSIILLIALVQTAASAAQPNFVIIFADDLGYGDLGCFGSKKIRTPRIDRMAAEGMRFPDFYAQAVCGPSRAALMTGCYPVRVATKQNKVEIMPRLHLQEITVAEVLKEVGYISMAIGKWHLAGHSQTAYDVELLPTRQGFDRYFGTPSSNDGVVNLIRDERMIERNVDLSTLTRRYTDEAIAFIKENKAHPFFVYLAYSMPHTRLGASAEFRGKSAAGLFGDVVEELDWNVGRLLDTLKSEGLDGSTYVIFTSDNGPWYLNRPIDAPDDPRTRNAKGEIAYPFNQRDERGPHGGSAGPLRGGKTSAWEGGVRVPCIVRAPGRVTPGAVCNEFATTLDVLPTFAHLGDGKVPADRVIDGHDITALLHGVRGARSPTKTFYYYQRNRLMAVRDGNWKLHLVRPEDDLWAIYSAPPESAEIKKPLLYDLANDAAEQHDLAARHPDVVARLLVLAEKARADLGDFNRVGAGARYFDPEPKRPDIGAARPADE